VEWGNTKSIDVWGRGGEGRSIFERKRKTILMLFARAGSKQYISFFLLIIGFKEISIV
jgi:hypothetical protein